MQIDVKDTAILVKVLPDGYAEKTFMGEWKRIKEHLNIESASVLLAAIFGGIYNIYPLKFKTNDDLLKAFDWLRDYFYKMGIQEECDDEYLPEVVYAKERITEEEP